VAKKDWLQDLEFSEAELSEMEENVNRRSSSKQPGIRRRLTRRLSDEEVDGVRSLSDDEHWRYADTERADMAELVPDLQKNPPKSAQRVAVLLEALRSTDAAIRRRNTEKLRAVGVLSKSEQIDTKKPAKIPPLPVGASSASDIEKFEQQAPDDAVELLAEELVEVASSEKPPARRKASTIRMPPGSRVTTVRPPVVPMEAELVAANHLLDEFFYKTQLPRSLPEMERRADFVYEYAEVHGIEDARILEFGALRSLATQLILRGASPVCIDHSTGAISPAGSVAPLITNFSDLPFSPASFSFAYFMDNRFGFLSSSSNKRQLESIHRCLRPGGGILIEVVNRDYIVQELPIRAWRDVYGNVLMEEVVFNYEDSRVIAYRTVILDGDRQLEREYTFRVYTQTELSRLLQDVGFECVECSGSIANKGVFFGPSSRNIILYARKI